MAIRGRSWPARFAIAGVGTFIGVWIYRSWAGPAVCTPYPVVEAIVDTISALHVIASWEFMRWTWRWFWGDEP